MVSIIKNNMHRFFYTNSAFIKDPIGSTRIGVDYENTLSLWVLNLPMLS